MSKQVDERVVSMRFDNSDFEKNVSTSMSTLDTLRQRLQLTESTKGLTGLGEASKKVDMSGLASGVDAVQAKFSALQVMGVTALANITNSAMRTGKSIVNSVIGPMLTGGKTRALNIEQAKFQFEGLGMDVEATMADASYAVDGTAYSLDAAAKVASQLGASGMRAGEDMRNSLRAVSGVAAMTGSSYEDIGSVFTKVAGQGRVMGDDLLRLSSRGINAAATLATSLGKTEAEVREMVTAGKVDFKMFADAMDSAFGEHATAANKTFVGAMSNVRSALGRIGAKFYTPFHANMIDPLNTIRTKINEVSAALDPAFSALEKFMQVASATFVDKLSKVDLSWLTDMISGLVGLGNFAGTILAPIKGAFTDIFPKGEGGGMQAMMTRFKEFTESLKLSETTSTKLQSTFRGLFAVLDIIGMAVSEAARGFLSLLGVTAPLGSSILDLTARFGEWLVKVRDSVKETGVFKSAADKVVGVVKKMSELLKTAAENVKSFWSKVSGTKIKLGGWDGFMDFLKNVGKLVAAAGEAIWEFLGKMKTMLSEVFNGGVVDFASVGLLGGLLKIGSVIADKFKGIDLSIGIFDNIKSVLSSVGDTLKTYQDTLKAEVLKKIAVAIAILAASILVLSMVDTDKLVKATTAMGVLMLMLTQMSKALTDIKSPTKSAAKISVMLGAVTSLLILAGAVKVLSTIEPGAMAMAILGMTSMLTALIGAMMVMSSADSGSVVKGSGQMILMALAVTAMVVPLKMISKMDNKSVIKGLGGIVSLLTTMTVAMTIMGNFKGGSVKNMGQMILMAGAMVILAEVMKKLSLLSWEGIGKGLAGITGAMATLVGALGIISGLKVSINASAILGLIVISGAIHTLGKVMVKLSTLSWEGIGKGLTGMVGAVTILVGAIGIMSSLKMSLSGSSIVGLAVAAGSIYVLGEVMLKLSYLGWDGIAKGLVGITTAMATLVIGLNMLKGTNAIAGSFGLILASSALLVFGKAVKSLGNMDVEVLAKGLISVALAFAILGAASALLSGLGPAMLMLSGALFLAGVGVLAFSAGITALSGSLVAAATAIVSAVKILIVGVIDIVNTMGKSITAALITLGEIFIKSVPVLAEALLVLGRALIEVVVSLIPDLTAGIARLIIGIVETLTEYVPKIVDVFFNFFVVVFDKLAEKIPELGASMSNLLNAVMKTLFDSFSSIDSGALLEVLLGVGILTLLMTSLAALTGVMPSAMLGVLGLGVLVAELGVVLAAIGGLAQIPGLQWLIGEGGNMLYTIGNAIGKFVGGIVGGVSEGMFSSLPRIGADLSLFAANLQPFIDSIGSIDGSVLTGATALADMLLTLTGASLMESITSWITGGSSIAEFSSSLLPFGEAVVAFSRTITGNVDEGAIQAAANAGIILAKMADTIPNTGGLVGFFAGNNDISTFGAQLNVFGRAIVNFSRTVTGNVNEGAVTSAANAGSVLVSLANTIPNTGGVLGFFAGNNDFTMFGSQIVSFGRAVVDFSKIVAGNVDSGAIQAAADAGMILSELSITAPKIGGLVGVFAGESDLSVFGSQLQSFAQAIVGFSTTVSGASIDLPSITSAVNAGKILSELSSTLGNTGGLVSLFVGEQSLSSFAKQLPLFGGGLKAFGTSVAGISVADVRSGVNAARLISELSDIKVSGGVFSGDTTYLSFGTTLSNFVKGIKGFATEISGLDSGTLSSQITALNGALDKMKSVSISGIDDVAKVFTNAGPKLSSAMKQTLTGVVDTITAQKGSFQTNGKVLVDAFSTGFKSGTTAPINTARNMVSSMLSVLSSGTYSSFFNAGAQAASGFANGITANSFRASAAASAMASAALSSARSALDIQSPSRKFFEVGAFSGQGLVNALISYVPKVAKAGSRMANSALDGFNNIVSTISNMLDSDMDMQPTIKPVLDLSNIKSGAGSINGMFGINPSIKTLTSAGVINSSMNRRRISGNADVVEAINDLKSKIDNVSGGDQYSIGDVTYDNGSAVADAVKALVRATKVERRV